MLTISWGTIKEDRGLHLSIEDLDYNLGKIWLSIIFYFLIADHAKLANVFVDEKHFWLGQTFESVLVD